MEFFNEILLDQSDEDKIKSLILKYQNRKRKTMQPSPYALFFLDKGKDILLQINEETNKIPTPEIAIERLFFEWNRISDYEKNIYMRASYALDFKPKTTTKETIAKFGKNTKVNKLRDFLALFSL